MPEDSSPSAPLHPENGADPAADQEPDLREVWDAEIATARARFEDLGDFELPDGSRARDLLADIDEDQNLLDVLDARLIGGNRQ